MKKLFIGIGGLIVLLIAAALTVPSFINWNDYKGQIIADCATHLILAIYPKRGPTPDVSELDMLQTQLAPGLTIQTLYADAGYDSEPNHQLLRDLLGITSIIPPKIGRPTTKPAKGRYRRLMQRLFKNIGRTNYGQRWQAETVMSMLKRNLGGHLRSRSRYGRELEMRLKTVVHNLMVV